MKSKIGEAGLVEKEHRGYKVLYFRHDCVYEPSDDTFMLADYMIHLKETGYEPRKILEIGGGSGYLSMLVKQLWPQAIIHVTEINPYAIRGLRMLGLHVFRCAYDYCIPSHETYDLGISNPPYLPLEQEKVLDCGGWIDKAWSTTRHDHILFCRRLVKRALRVLIVTSSLIGGPGNIIRCLDEHGFEAKIVDQKKFFYETLYLVEGILKTPG